MGQTPQSPGAGREYGAAGSSGAAAGDPEGPTESAAGGRATKVSVSRLREPVVLESSWAEALPEFRLAEEGDEVAEVGGLNLWISTVDPGASQTLIGVTAPGFLFFL